MTAELVVGMMQLFVLLMILYRLRPRSIEAKCEPSVGSKSSSPQMQSTGAVEVPSVPHSDLCERLELHSGRWEHAGWVRKNSPAWKQVYDTPGQALREPEGNFVEGVQCR